MTNSWNKSELLKRKLALLHEVRRRQCEASYYEFVKEAFTILNPGEEFEDNWHIKYVCDEIQHEAERIIAKIPKQCDVIIINVPPRSLKSISVTVCLAAWIWIHAPHIKHIGSSYSADLSLDHNTYTKTIVESAWYQANWGDEIQISKDQNTKGYFRNTKRGFRSCTSTGGGITGKGGDIITIDDPVNPEYADSDTERERGNRYYDKTLSSRLDNPDIGIHIVVMQRLHENDLTGHLLNKAKEGLRIKHICIPAEVTEFISPPELRDKYSEDGLFFPNRFTRDVLDQLEISAGGLTYSGQYLQMPFTPGGAIINIKKFGWFTMEDVPAGIVWNFAIDSAYTKKLSNDPSGMIAYCVHKNNYYIRSATSVWMEFPDLCRHIRMWVHQNGYSHKSRVLVEPKASGMSVAQQMKETTDINMILDKAPTTDKVLRVQEVTPKVDAERVFLLRGASWVDKFTSQCEMFPNGLHDEYPDCLAIMLSKKVPSRSVRYTFAN